MQVKATIKYHLTFLGMAITSTTTPLPKKKKIKIISTGKDVKKSEAMDFEGRHVKWCRCAGKQYCMLSCVRFFATVWTVAPQGPLSIGFSRQEYWSGLPFLPLGDLPIPGIEPVSPASPALQVDSLLLNHQGSPKNRIVVPRKVQHRIIM